MSRQKYLVIVQSKKSVENIGPYRSLEAADRAVHEFADCGEEVWYERLTSPEDYLKHVASKSGADVKKGSKLVADRL